MLNPLTFLALAMLDAAPTAVPEEVTLHCDAGPVERTFAGELWSIHSCSDARTLLIVIPGSRDEFIYTVYTVNGRTAVGGYGPGGGRDIAATTQELRRLTAADLEALVAETRSRSPESRAARGETTIRR